FAPYMPAGVRPESRFIETESQLQQALTPAAPIRYPVLVEIESQLQQTPDGGIVVPRRHGVSTLKAWIGVLGVVLSAAFGAATAVAETSQQAPADSSELAQRLDALAREVADLKQGAAAGPLESHHGLGPAASKVYSVGSGVSIGGYGEVGVTGVRDEQTAGGGTSTESEAATGRTVDLIPQIVYVGYKFDERPL